MEKIAIPEDFVEEIKNHQMLDELLDIDIEIYKAKYDAAIKALDKNAAYEAKQDGRRTAIASKKNHEDMWAAIGRAVPATLEGRWTLDSSDWTLHQTSRRDPSKGLGDLLGALGDALGTKGPTTSKAPE